MPIIGGKVTKVEAKRLKDEPNEGVNINVKVDNVSKEKGRTKVEYVYSIAYLKDVAEITIVGEIYAEGKDVEDLDKQWKDKKQLPASFMEQLLMSLTYTGSAIGTLLAFAINVTAPINVPPVRLAPAEKAKAS